MLLKLHQIACRVSSLNFHKFSVEWLVELPLHISSPLDLGSGFALNSQALCAIGSGCVLNFLFRNFDHGCAFAISNFRW